MKTYNTIVLVTTPSANYSYKNKGSIYPFTSILYIGTILKQNGYNVKIIDDWYDKDYIDHLKNFVTNNRDRIIYIGFSVMTVCVPSSLLASTEIKEISNELPIVWGGAHPTLFPEQTLKNDAIDIVVINEGLSAAIDIAEHLQKNEDLSNVLGIGYKDILNNIKITSPAPLDSIKDLVINKEFK